VAPPSPPERRTTGPRVLVVPGSYVFDNVGDVVMAQVAVARLREALPGADLRLYAASQELLDANDLADTRAVSDRPWFVWSAAVERWRRRAPGGALLALPDEHPRRFLRLARLGRLVSDPAAAAAFLDEVAQADLVVLPGQGAMRDGSDRRTLRYATLALVARAFAVPVVAVGQGIGPLDDPRLADRIGVALRTFHGLGVRDPGPSAETVAGLGIDPARWRVTGDDAIEAVVGRGALPAPDDRIGVSLRNNRAAAVPADLPAAVGRSIGASRPGARVELVSMMEKAARGGVSDSAFLAGVDPGAASAVVGHEARADVALDALASCRVVISGTYHAAVFAQSLGIPVICLAATPYYVQKLQGVLAQFGDVGGTLLDPNDPAFERDLAAAIDRWWDGSDEVGEQLRTDAAAQAAGARRFFLDRISVVAA